MTKKMNPEKLYNITTAYTKLMWPLAKFFHMFPYGKQINWSLFIPDYIAKLDIPEGILKEWAILDCFDMLSPAYDNPQTIGTLRRWFAESNMMATEVHYGYNGIEGRGIRKE